MAALVTVKDLQVGFRARRTLTQAVKGVSFSVKAGETLGIVGESGSGKSVTSLALMGLLPANGQVTKGQIQWQPAGEAAQDLLTLPDRQMRSLRGNDMAMIFQEPMTSLNPVHTCGQQVAEALRLHKGLDKKEAREATLEWFRQVELPRVEAMYDSYPHQLSGGQKQRIIIAMAVCCHPQLLIADEPTTALDVTVQRSILQLLRKLQATHNMAMIFISHDLGVIAEMADHVLVMRKGEEVEQDTVEAIFEAPEQPYTRGLLACRPTMTRRLYRMPVLAQFTEQTGEASFTEVSETDFANRQTQLQTQEPLLRVQQLKTYFKSNRKHEPVKAVDDVSFDVYPGETLGIVGESGSGKTTLGRSILRLVDPTAGEVQYGTHNLTQLTQKALRPLRKELQIIFQDPYSSLNPRMRIGEAILEPMALHGVGDNLAERKARVIALLEKVELQADHYQRYPHQFSGGQRQRICIARALAVAPRLLVCDESVSALDVSVQATILNLLKDLQEEMGLTYLFISHDLSVVRFMSDRILIMQSGKVVEQGDAETIYQQPQKIYTQQLLAAIPAATLTEARQRRQSSIS